jgi:hypothetical protein
VSIAHRLRSVGGVLSPDRKLVKGANMSEEKASSIAEWYAAGNVVLTTEQVAALNETAVELSGPAVVLDPDGLHLGRTVMAHGDGLERRVLIYVKELDRDGQTETLQTVSHETWEQWRETTRQMTE